MLMVVLVDKRVVGTEASFRLSPQHFIGPVDTGPSSPKTGVFEFLVDVSVAVVVFTG